MKTNEAKSKQWQARFYTIWNSKFNKLPKSMQEDIECSTAGATAGQLSADASAETDREFTRANLPEELCEALADCMPFLIPGSGIRERVEAALKKARGE